MTAPRKPTAAPDLRALIGGEVISAWPDDGNWGSQDDDWIVGVARRSWEGPAFVPRPGQNVSAWRQIAMVRGCALARAFAAHLNELRENG